MNAPDPLTAALELLKTDVRGLRPIMGFGPDPSWSAIVPGSEALRCWHNLRDDVEKTGFWPVFVGGFAGGAEIANQTIDQWAEEVSDSDAPTRETPAEILEAALALPFEKWVEQERDPQFQIAKHLREAERFDAIPHASFMAKIHRDMAADWRKRCDNQRAKHGFNPDDHEVPPQVNRNPPQHELHCLQCYKDFHSSVQADAVAILFLPTRSSWQVPAYLSYSTTEGARPSHVHVAALKWLFDHFGAELIGIENRVVEVIPRLRPANKAAALQAANAIGAYSQCSITSENELASLEELAFYLMESEYWSFCWP